MKSLFYLILILLCVSCNNITVSKNPEDPKVPQVVACTTNCRMFVSDPHDGNLGGAAGADTLCASDPNKPATGTYKALIMDNSRGQNTNWVLKPNTSYFRPDGITLVGTTGPEAVFDIGNPGFFALEDAMNSRDYYTGMMWTSGTKWDVDGNPNFTCLNWTSNSHLHLGDSGLTGDASDFFIANTAVACQNAIHLVCVEQ